MIESFKKYVYFCVCINSDNDILHYIDYLEELFKRCIHKVDYLRPSNEPTTEVNEFIKEYTESWSITKLTEAQRNLLVFCKMIIDHKYEKSISMLSFDKVTEDIEVHIHENIKRAVEESYGLDSLTETKLYLTFSRIYRMSLTDKDTNDI